MIPAQFDYAAPDSVNEAITLMKHSQGARILAGGHDLLPQLKLRRLSPALLIDLRNIPDLDGIIQDGSGNSAQIGAMSTCANSFKSSALGSRCLSPLSKSTARRPASSGCSFICFT